MTDVKYIGGNPICDATARAALDGLGTVKTASTVASMTDTRSIYKYTGSESGYTANALYYYNGSAWSEITTEQSSQSSTGDSAVEFVSGMYYQKNAGMYIGTPLSGEQFATPRIRIDGQTNIYYTGRSGGNVASWFDENNKCLGTTTNANGETLINYDVLQDAPTGAAIVQLISRTMKNNNPPSTTPIVTLSNPIKRNVVGTTDGSVDDSDAIQFLCDNNRNVKLPSLQAGSYIKLSKTIHINPIICRSFDGNNIRIRNDENVVSFNVLGTTNITNSGSASDDVIKNESSFEFKNVILMGVNSSTATSATVLTIAKTYGAIIHDNFFSGCYRGIVCEEHSRNMKIYSNEIRLCRMEAILLSKGASMHQWNIFGNVIFNAHKGIVIDSPTSVANVQITGNDIEEWDQHSQTDQLSDNVRCILIISSTDYSDGQDIMSEIEIVGNSIQSHGVGVIIDLQGDSSKKIKDLCITGNHISNGGVAQIKVDNASSIVISGNTVRGSGSINIGNTEGLSINGNTISGNINLTDNTTKFVIASNFTNGIVTEGTVSGVISGNRISVNPTFGHTSGKVFVASNMINGTVSASDYVEVSGNTTN